MLRSLAIGLVGLLMLAVAGADLVSRAAAMAIPDTSLTALGSTDHPDSTVMPTEGDGPPPAVTTTQNVLLVGTDSREGLTAEERKEMVAGDHGNSLTDTVIWVQYLPDIRELRMVSFPRDLAVETETQGTEKLNALHPLFGANRLVEEVEGIVGADLDHYVEIDLAGLVALTDAIGGVEVCLEEPMNDATVGHIPEGCQVLDGIDAGRFVRARKVSDSFGSGTYGRAARQQYFLRQAMSKVLSAGTLANPAAVRRLVGVASRVAVVDDGLTINEMRDLAKVFRSIEPEEVDGVNVPAEGFTGDDGLYYDRLVEEDAEKLFRALRLGTELPDFDDADGPGGRSTPMDGDLDDRTEDASAE